LPYAPAWTLDDMVAVAAKEKIKIEYTTVYKNLKTQEQDFKKINSLKTTNVSKASAVPEVKNGRLYNGVKWYPTTITNYNPLPGFNIFGTGLCIRIKNNNDKIINFIKDNGADYGWSWCSNFPTSDPDFQNILVYSAGKNKPNKYRDRTSEYPELGFRPNQYSKEILGYDPKTQKSVWVPTKDNGKYEIVELPKATSKTSTTRQIYVDAENDGSPLKGATFAPSGFFGSQPNNKSIKVLVVNKTARTGAAAEVGNILKSFGFITSKAISCVISTYVDPGAENLDIYTPGFREVSEVGRQLWGSPQVKKLLSIPGVINTLTQAKVVDAVNYSEFTKLFELPTFSSTSIFQNPFSNYDGRHS